MKEEDLIRKQCGKTNPFRVPEGYFENLPLQIMDSLPAQEVVMTVRKTPTLVRLRPYSVAVAVCGLIFGIGVVATKFFNGQSDFANIPVTTEEYTIDQIADYAMVDNVSMYRMISDESTEDIH